MSTELFAPSHRLNHPGSNPRHSTTDLGDPWVSQLLLAESTSALGFGVALWHALSTKEFQRTLLCVALGQASLASLVSAQPAPHRAVVMLGAGVPLHTVLHRTNTLYFATVAALRLDLSLVPTASTTGLLVGGLDLTWGLTGTEFEWWHWGRNNGNDAMHFATFLGFPLTPLAWSVVSGFLVALGMRWACSAARAVGPARRTARTWRRTRCVR